MNLPLKGITILDLTRMLPGGYSSMILADLGADVIQVENPKYQLNIQNLPPYFQKDETRISAFSSTLCRNKKSITLNLKEDKGREIFYKLVESSDVVIDTFRPKVVNRLKIDYETLSKINKSIICCSLSGFGQDGPYEQIAGHDLNYIGISGLLGMNMSNENTKPVVPSVLKTGDIGGALYFVIGILGAIMARNNDPEKRGQFVDVSMFESAFAFMPQPLMYSFATLYKKAGVGPSDGLSGGDPFYSVYKTKDNRFMAVGAIEPKFRVNLCETVGRDDLKPKIWAQGEDRIMFFKELSKIFLSKTQKEWVQTFKNIDACVTPVNTVREALENDHVKSRKLIVDQPHPILGNIKNMALPIKMSRSQLTIRTFAPDLGEQNKEILNSLNYSDEQIEEYKKKGII